MTKTLVYINSHAADNLKALAKPQAIIAFIDRLNSNPETVGDYRQPDPRARRVSGSPGDGRTGGSSGRN